MIDCAGCRGETPVWIPRRHRQQIGQNSAVESVAATAALMRFADTAVPTAARVAEAAYRAENGIVGTDAGWMDFLACANGGVNRIDAGTPPQVTRLADTLGTPLILIDTLARSQRAGTCDNTSASSRINNRHTAITTGSPRAAITQRSPRFNQCRSGRSSSARATECTAS